MRLAGRAGRARSECAPCLIQRSGPRVAQCSRCPVVCLINAAVRQHTPGLTYPPAGVPTGLPLRWKIPFLRLPSKKRTSSLPSSAVSCHGDESDSAHKVVDLTARPEVRLVAPPYHPETRSAQCPPRRARAERGRRAVRCARRSAHARGGRAVVTCAAACTAQCSKCSQDPGRPVGRCRAAAKASLRHRQGGHALQLRQAPLTV